jgi:uncharacterized protein (TIGR03083 family)
MLLTPRYDGSALFDIEGAPDDALAPVVRQRRRLASILATLDDDQWATPSRCGGWSVQDVVAHLVGVTTFWQASVAAGRHGTPTTILANFDPAATPPMMVAPMRSLAPVEVLDRLTAADDGFLGAIADLDEDGWATLAEAPPGHMPVRLVCAHALWDSWVHERDIVLPLGLSPTVEADEVGLCLRYSAALGPAFALPAGTASPGTFTVDARDPDISFVLEVPLGRAQGSDPVVVRSGDAPAGAPRLRGDAVALVEALSLRVPLPVSTPEPWSRLLGGLAAAFDAEVEVAAPTL